MYPDGVDFGLKVVPILAVWGPSLYYSALWTLRVTRVVSNVTVFIVAYNPSQGIYNGIY